MSIASSRDMIDLTPLMVRELYFSGDSVDWDKIPGAHTDHFLRSLARYTLSGMDWVFSPGARSEKAGTTVRFSYLDKKWLTIQLKDDLTGVTITLDDGRSIEKPVIKEFGKLRITGMRRFATGSILEECIVNRLLYWGELKLLDYIENPPVAHSDQEEILRNISCTINIGKLVKRFSDSQIIIHKEFRRVVLAAEMRKRFTDDLATEIIEDGPNYTVSKYTRTTYELGLKKVATPTATLIEAFQAYLTPHSTQTE